MTWLIKRYLLATYVEGAFKRGGRLFKTGVYCYVIQLVPECTLGGGGLEPEGLVTETYVRRVTGYQGLVVTSRVSYRGVGDIPLRYYHKLLFQPQL